MKVLHLLKTSIGANWAVRQVRELIKLGVDVHVAVPSGGPRIPEYTAVGATVHEVQTDFPMRHLWHYPQVFNAFRQLVAQVNPDLIHSHFVGTTLTMRLALGRNHSIPRIFQVPGPLHLEYPLLRWAEVLTAGKQDYWVGSCQWTRNCYRQMGIPSDRVFLSYYGMDFHLLDQPRTGKLRQELGVDADTKLVGMVAAMYPPKRLLGQTQGIKGHEDLIDAIALCLQHEPNILGVFIGGAWNGATAYEQQLRDYGRKKCGDRAVFLGMRDDVTDLLPDLNVSVNPSHSENLAGTTVESLVFDVPCVVTNVGGFPDLIQPGETGWLVSPRNPEQLAAAILEALRDPVRSRQMARRGANLAQQIGDIRENAKEIFSIYQTVLAGTPEISELSKNDSRSTDYYSLKRS
ncbi:MAG TPA: glycosyltransferase family 4 protein [Allocoleopsis sp.]